MVVYVFGSVLKIKKQRKILGIEIRGRTVAYPSQSSPLEKRGVEGTE